MSFGRPPGFSVFVPAPPDRGSFPLDHDGDCKEAMLEYMKCMKANRSDNGKCRHLSQRYLQCRMDNGLMEKDDMKNLGYQGNEKELADAALAKAAAAASSTGGAAAGAKKQGSAAPVPEQPPKPAGRLV